jgi:hypothetical protein
MIQIQACEGCEVIACIADPGMDLARENGGLGGFVCRSCRQFKPWRESMSDGIDDDDDKRVSNLEMIDRSIVGVSGIRRVQCPYGRVLKVRITLCVGCFQKRMEAANAVKDYRRKHWIEEND